MSPGGSGNCQRRQLRSCRQPLALLRGLRNTLARRMRARGREMRGQDTEFDFDRYQQLLAEADDEAKRLALIDVLIKERAKERLETQRASDRVAMTATTIAKVLGTSAAQ